MLTLKRASKHRPGGPWDPDDFDVFEGARHVGRIMRTHHAPANAPWFWSITVRAPQGARDRGYAASREQAMARFKAAWAKPD